MVVREVKLLGTSMLVLNLRFLRLETLDTPLLWADWAPFLSDTLESSTLTSSIWWIFVNSRTPTQATKSIHIIFVCRISTDKTPNYRWKNKQIKISSYIGKPQVNEHYTEVKWETKLPKRMKKYRNLVLI